MIKTLRRFGIPGASAYTYRISQAGHMFTTTASGKDVKKLAGIRKELRGHIVLDSLSKNATYVVQVVYPVFTDVASFTDMIEDLTRRMNNYAHAREKLGGTVAPFYFSGLFPGMGAYVTVLGDPGQTTGVPATDHGSRPVFHRLVDAGVYPVSHGAVRKTQAGGYVVSNPALLIDIPKGMHAAYTKYRRVEEPVDAWIAAGGGTWGDAYSTYSLHRERGTSGSSSSSVAGANWALTLNGTLTKHLSTTIKHIETGRSSVRPVDPTLSKLLNTVIASGTKLGQGAYGQVFGLVLDERTLSNIVTLKAALTNTIEFSKPKPRSRVVLKIERLDASKPLLVKDVRRLAGEAYIQQYVHTNAGMAKQRKRRRHPVPVVTPGVYFSGTLANEYHLICMEYVHGVSLGKIVSRGVVTDAVYNAMELAVKTMLRNGVVHSDLHKNNVFVVKSGRSISVQILDFGFASIVPPAMRAKIDRVLDETGSIDEAFHATGLIETIDAAKIGFRYYHSNAKMMRLLKSMKNINPTSGLRSHRVFVGSSKTASPNVSSKSSTFGTPKTPMTVGTNQTMPTAPTLSVVRRGLRALKIAKRQPGSTRSSRSSRSSSSTIAPTVFASATAGRRS